MLVFGVFLNGYLIAQFVDNFSFLKIFNLILIFFQWNCILKKIYFFDMQFSLVTNAIAWVIKYYFDMS
jgi:hypothetical protein